MLLFAQSTANYNSPFCNSKMLFHQLRVRGCFLTPATHRHITVNPMSTFELNNCLRYFLLKSLRASLMHFASLMVLLLYLLSPSLFGSSFYNFVFLPLTTGRKWCCTKRIVCTQPQAELGGQAQM